VVVSHGGAIRSWVGVRARNADGRFVLDRPLANTGAVVLEGDTAAGWTVLTWEDEPVPAEVAGARN
jgi:probable phosphoglycerate mutase